LATVLVQIIMIDLVFSLDSVLTAVGMVRPEDYQAHWVPLTIMITAVLIAIVVMIVFSGPIARFVNNHPSIKMLALSFLILIGVVLVAEGLHTHIPRGYIYFSMAFALLVEMLNLRAAARSMKQHEALETI
jgi:predicted tellurium resistance membrane protein TerC